MIKRTITQTRPNTSVQFVNIMSNDQTLVSEEVKSYITDNYITTNKVSFENGVISEDGLTLTIVKMWANQEAINEYYADPYIIENLISVRVGFLATNSVSSTINDEVV